MKRIIFSLAVFLFASAALGQVGIPPGVVFGNPTPGGACNAGAGQIISATGLIYTCQSGVWTAGGGGGSGSPAQYVFYVVNSQSGTCASAPNCYTMTGDDSIDNSTTWTSLATAVNAISSFQVNTQKVAAVVIKFAGTPTGAYKYGTGPAFTVPVTIQCDENSGTFFDYSGSAHAMDFGPNNLASNNLQSGIYTVKGCGFTGGATMTEGLFFNAFVVNIRVLNNTFRNFGNATTTVWGIRTNGDGSNWDIEVAQNVVWNDDATARNFFSTNGGASSTQVSSQVRFHDNILGNFPSANPAVCATASGIGLYTAGYASRVTNNNFACGWAPAVWVGKNAANTVISGNYFESLASGSTIPIIQFGETTLSITVDSLKVVDNNFDIHGQAIGVIGPVTATSYLTNAYICDNNIERLSGVTPMVTLNNNATQTGNEVCHTVATTSFPPTTGTPYTYIHTVGSLIPAWTYIGKQSVSDNFTRANGALATPWVPVTNVNLSAFAIASNTLTCGGANTCVALYSQDLGNDQSASMQIATVPTGTNQAAVITRGSVNPTASAQTYYVCTYVNGTGMQLYKAVAGVFTQLGSTVAKTGAIGDVIELTSVGSVHTCSYNGTIVIRAIDTAITTGYAGVELVGTSGAIANWTAKGLQ